MDRSLSGKNVFVTGGSRGIGLAIACRLAQEGANITIAAKTAEPNPKLPGTLYTAAAAIEAAGGRCLPIQVDIRDELALQAAVNRSAEHFNGLDVLINNASAIHLTPTDMTPMKRFDLMFGVNVRGTYASTQACLSHLRASGKAGRNPHVLNLSPPLNLNPNWFAPHVAYTMAKYGMSMCVLGHAREFKHQGIAVNALWPQTAIYTAAMQMIPGVLPEHCREPAIMADAAVHILQRTASDPDGTGQFFIDEAVLRQAGVSNFDHYATVPGSQQIQRDFFLD
ncbi:NAD(P)-dependent oxidoreductase [Limnobacter humi]|uniref:NAD(P)-dependent oxidoreductase n=1 Tax=Limnobacter humi TaxID=1778671 RepID=A0ABT1WDJ7_9BURK|nr:NAD(P)-dependent oxidoreductase [Limnobacter humi]MCQ8895594.1 NAD(P)-dependent oxidoreductase [Limnobacter humi]